MAINIDLDTQLASNMVVLAQQAVANTQNFAHYANLAFTRDLLQSGQSATAGLLAALNAADRTPVMKDAPEYFADHDHYHELKMSTAAAPNTTEHIALVSAANANQLTSALAQAAIQAAKNEDGSARFPGFQTSQIPFGSTINVTNTGTSNLGKLAIGLLSAIGLSSALLGLIKAAIPSPAAGQSPAPVSAVPPVAVPPAANPPPAEAAASPMTIEGILDWELTPDGQLNTTIQPVGSAGS